MSAQTNIEWADSTWNPWMGCTKVSPACDHCYAERDTRRFGRVEWGAGKSRVRTSAANWKLPERWNREPWVQCSCGWRGAGIPGVNGCARCGWHAKVERTRRRVFSASLADWLDNEIPIETFVDFLDLIRRTRNLDWLLLTKRIGNFDRRFEQAENFVWSGEGNGPLYRFIHEWHENIMAGPPSNVWLGITVVDQVEADRDVPKLLRVPARVRFLSIEPMLSGIDLTWWIGREPAVGASTYLDSDDIERCDLTGTPVDGIDWIICGGESGPHARPMHPSWVRRLRDQCAAAGTAFFFKQWGEWAPWANEEHFTHLGRERRAHAWIDARDGSNGKCWIVDEEGAWSNWTGDPESDDNGALHPEIAVMGWHGKRDAGRLLDGAQYLSFPHPVH